MTTPTTPSDEPGGGGPAAGCPGSPVHPVAQGTTGSDATADALRRGVTTDPVRRRTVMALLLVMVALGGFAIADVASSPSAAGPGSSSVGPLGGPNGLGTSNSGQAPTGFGDANSGTAGNSGVGNAGRGGGLQVPGFGRLPTVGGGAGSTAPGSAASGSPSNIAAIAAKVSPALVDINVTFGYARASGAGTGIVLTGNGEVLTNNHVINGATSISVTDIGNRKTYRAVVKGYDRAHDVAVIQLQGAARLATATIAPPSAAVVGAGVVAVGNAGGSGGTPSSAGGSITAVNQAITARDDLDGTAEQLTGLLATNAAVQPGDSGGALVVASGAVVGMTTAGSAGFSFRGASGQGFAIVINDALREVRTINSGHGTSTIHVGGTAFLGVRVSSLGAIGGLGSAAPSGATVSSVVAGSAAAGAGIVSGDTITSLGGKSVASASALSQLLVPHHPGDTVVIGYTDAGGRGHSATVTLASGPPA